MNKLKIGIRLGLGFGAIILLLLLISLVGIFSLKSGGNKTDEIVNNRYAKVLMLSKVRTNTSDYGHNLRNLLLTSDAEETKVFLNSMKNAAAANGKAMDKVESALDTPEGKKIFMGIKEARGLYVAAAGEDLRLLQGGERQKAIDFLLSTVVPAENAFFVSIDQFNELSTQVMDRAGAEGIQQASDATVQVGVLTALAAVLAAVIAALITRSITRPLNQAMVVAQAVAIGDLTSRIEILGRDESAKLLQSIRDMNDNLREIVGNVRTGSSTIAAASSQIASGNLELSSRTEEQASSLEETASSIEELTGTVKQNSENARQANTLALSASAAATEGGVAVAQVVETMHSIEASAGKIVDIIGVIDGLAFQTNILALNAAVEAARAGEQGRGFAVVATEVRNLAQRSAAAAKEIKILINDSVDQVENGGRQVDQAGATMQKIVDSIKRVTDIMGEIAVASQEQSSGIEQINQAIMQMDDVTQQNASLVEEAAAAAASLEEQSVKLVRSVDMFKLDNSVAASASLAQRGERKLAPLEITPSRKLVSAPQKRALPLPKQILPVPKTARAAADQDWQEF